MSVDVEATLRDPSSPLFTPQWVPDEDEHEAFLQDPVAVPPSFGKSNNTNISRANRKREKKE